MEMLIYLLKAVQKVTAKMYISFSCPSQLPVAPNQLVQKGPVKRGTEFPDVHGQFDFLVVDYCLLTFSIRQ